MIGELLLEPVEALAEGRERDAVGLVLGLVPARAETELDPAAAHLVDLRPR